MKVLHIFNEIKYSGAEIMYANAAPFFEAEGVEMIALSTGERLGDFSPQFETANIEVRHLHLKNRTLNLIYLFKYFKKIYFFVKEHKIDVIHIHRSSFYIYFSFIGFLTGINTIRTVHNVFKNRTATWIKAYLERLLARKAFNVIFQSISESVYMNELLYYKNPTTRINNWYDNKKFYPASSPSERKAGREKLGIPIESLVIISTGGCSHVKNHHDIIKTLKIVNKNIIYLHLGCGATEEEEKQLAISSSVSDKVRFLGNQINVRDYLIISDIYIMPSKYEGLGNAALEAMACGIPSIFYDVPGLRDLIKDDDNGFLIEPDIRLLAEKIIFLDNNPEVSKQKGLNSIHFVNDNFSIMKGVKSILALYNQK